MMTYGVIEQTKMRVNHFLEKEFSHFSRDDLPNLRNILESVSIFICIFIASALSYLGAESLSAHPQLKAYLLKACTDGIGVYLWNIIVSIGILSFCLTIIFPFEGIAKITAAILANANSIGALMAGLLAGQAFYGLSSSTAKLWVKVLGGGLGGVLGVVLLLMLAVIWLLSYLSKKKNFLAKIKQVRPAVRLLVVAIATTPLFMWVSSVG